MKSIPLPDGKSGNTIVLAAVADLQPAHAWVQLAEDGSRIKFSCNRPILGLSTVGLNVVVGAIFEFSKDWISKTNSYHLGSGLRRQCLFTSRLSWPVSRAGADVV